MQELHTKHDNLVNIIAAYVLQTPNEVYIPAQLNQFLEAHTPDKVCDRHLANFAHDFLAQCFDVDLFELADGSYAYMILDELEAHEFPRLDIRKIERFSLISDAGMCGMSRERNHNLLNTLEPTVHRSRDNFAPHIFTPTFYRWSSWKNWQSFGGSITLWRL